MSHRGLLLVVLFAVPVQVAAEQPAKLNCKITVTRILGFDAGERHIVIGGHTGRGGVVQIWNVRQRKVVTSPSATHVAMSRDGGTLATLNDTGKNWTTVNIWNLRKGPPFDRHAICVPVAAIHCLALSSHGRTAAIAGGNGVFLVSAVAAAVGKKKAARRRKPAGKWLVMPNANQLQRAVFAIEFSPGNSRLIVGGWTKVGQRFVNRRGRPIRVARGRPKAFVRLVEANTMTTVSLNPRFPGAPEPGDGIERWQFSPKGQKVALLRPTSPATIFDAGNGKELRSYADDLHNFGKNPVGPRSSLLYLPGGRLIVGASGVPPQRAKICVAVRFFPLGGGLMLKGMKWLVGFKPRQAGAIQLLNGRWPRIPRVAVRGGVEFLTLSPDGRHFAAGSSDKRSVAIRSVANPKLGIVKVVQGRDCALFSRDGRFLATIEPPRSGKSTTILIHKVRK